jgi:predicted nucleic acid-binding protein
MPKLIYLDVCALSRPFDDQSFMRIRLETEAVNLILSKGKEGKFSLLVSPVHDAEIRAIDDPVERIKLVAVIDEMGVRIKGDLSKMRARGEELIRLGFGVGDAAHMAFAEFHGAELVTCDDRVIRKCLRHKIGVWCGNPVSFCEKEGLR